MRSPDAREHLDNILRISREMVSANGFSPKLAALLLEMEEALASYDEFCFSEHRSVSVGVSDNLTGPYRHPITTKAQHFKLPLGLEES